MRGKSFPPLFPICRECGQPTCMVFATQVAEGGKGSEDCPPLTAENRQKLEACLGEFNFK
ncbi:MAG: hypothetical protein LLG06_01185 [Desulfobacteraceae bacterium]|nr:hypothetical protein [Desulfobacteraceae bacterium]